MVLLLVEGVPACRKTTAVKYLNGTLEVQHTTAVVVYSSSIDIIVAVLVQSTSSYYKHQLWR